MTKKTFMLSLTIISILAIATSLMAMKVEPIISYQAFLTDSDDVPLNGMFDMTFRIMDESGAMMWEESHGGVEVSEGFFTVVLGETDPIPPDAFVSGSDEGEYAVRNLEVQIGEDPPFAPIARLLTAPYSVASHRVAGDIFTSPGSIRMGVEPEPFNSSVEIRALSDHSDLTFFDPLADNDDKTVSRMSVSTGGQFGWNLFLPHTSPPRPVMDMNSDSDGALNWTFFYPEILDPDEPALRIRTWADPDGVNGTAEIQLFSSPPFPSVYPVIDLYTYEGSGGISLNEPESGFMTIHSPRSITFVDGGSGATTGILRGDGDSYLLNNLGIGTSGTGNILTIAPNTEADPIADAWTVYSSRRWKKNVRAIQNPIEKIERLRGVSFDWKADGKHDIGLIAEEVGEVIPEVVAYEENGVDAKSVDYARLVAVLIEGIKEQQNEIERLKAKIADYDALNSKMSELTKTISLLKSSIEQNDGLASFSKSTD